MTRTKVAPLAMLLGFTRAAVRHPWRVLAAAALLTAGATALATRLEIRSSFEELLPKDLPSVAQIQELSRRVGGDGNVLVNIESLDGPEGLGRAQRLAPVLARDFLAMGSHRVRSVEFDVGEIQRWYTEHWPLFATVEELTAARDGLRAEIRKRTAAANPLVVELSEDEEAPAATAAAAPPSRLVQLFDPQRPLPREQIAERFSSNVDGFLVHPDRSSLTLVVRPVGSSLGVREARALLDELRAVADRHRDELSAGKLRVGFAGTVPMFIAEYEAVVGDVASTAALCTALVLLSVILFFRDVRSVVSVGLCVAAGVALTFGVTWIAIGYLNTQTAFLGSIVVGNGINYGLIYLARVKQLRRAGEPLLTACEDGARTTAMATLLASAATSVSFGVLALAGNRGFRHFGFIGGIGMLLCWAATFALAPALLSVFEKIRPVAPVPAAAGRSTSLAAIDWLFARPRAILAGFAAVTLAASALFLLRLPHSMERNLDNLSNELRGVEELRRDHARAQTSLGKSIAGSVALLDSRDDAERFCQAIRTRMQHAPASRLIDGCETISSVVPRDQEAKLSLLREVRAELSDRVLAHVDPKLRERLVSIRQDLEAQRPVSADEAPATLLDRFRERDGNVGRLAVITARPDAKLELGPNLQAFTDAGRGVPVGVKKVDATGESVIFADLLRNIEKEGPRTTLLSFAGVCGIVLFLLRDAGMGARVLGSLAAGVLLMGGMAAAANLKVNFLNVIAYPITFGIAVDYGANIAVRVRERGGRVLESLAEVGPAVILCSWTTIIGYGSLLLSLNRAMRSFGWYAILGEATTLLTAMVMLPAMMLLARRRASLKA
ncbi:MAG TPA: MMPL family transporter [Myxococcales bacterium]